MLLKNYLFILLIGILFVSSCQKKDTPITLPPKGDGAVMSADMGAEYEYQYFINLDLQKVVHVSKTNLWHLAFQSGNLEKGIYVNGGQGMAAYNTGKTNFSSVGYADTLQAYRNWRYDASSGEADSTAMANWDVRNEIFLVKLDETNTKIRKVKVKYEDAFEYIIEVGDINSTSGADITILKNKGQQYTYFSFDFLTTIDGVEPTSTDKWDFVFTKFSHTFYDQNPPLPYVVVGALLARNTYAYKDSLTDFNAIDKAFATSVPLSAKRDAIGFDWKSYSIDNFTYTINKKYNYIIKNADGRYYKLRFLDFYSASGVKGSPKFEFKRLD